MLHHQQLSNPTYINSSTSISEPIKPFGGFDHKYTPEEYLQHIEGRVTFSFFQPTTSHEHKFWHARRMAFIQCSLTGTALSWYICLNDTYKQEWSAFVQAFKKQFSSQKNAYYEQVEALTLVKNDNETVRHFALKVQQLVEKGWSNGDASTINLNCNESFTKGRKILKDPSTVLEPSIPFHTLVKLVDAEDKAKDKIRTHDLTLEVSSITNQLQSQNLETQQSEHLIFTQPRDPNNKHKPDYKKIVHIVIKQITSSLLVARNNELMKTKEMPMLDLNLPKNLLYNTSVLLLVTISLTEHITNPQNPMIDTVVEVHHVRVVQIAILHYKIDIVLTPETDTDMTELLLLHNLTDQDMTTIDEIHVPIVHHIDFHIDHHIDKIRAIDIDHVLTVVIDNFHNTLRHIDLLLNHDSLHLLDLDQVLKQKIKAITFKQNNQIHLITLKYKCTILQKWLTL